MKRHESLRAQAVRIKLYLLVMGILVLGMLLAKGNTKGSPMKEQEPELEEEPPEALPENEPEVPIAYDGTIRILLMTTGFSGQVHEAVRLTSEHEMFVAGTAGEDYGSAAELFLSWEEDSLILNGEVLAEVPETFVVTAEKLGEESMEKSSEKTLEAVDFTSGLCDPGVSIISLQRNHGTPAYEGILEIWPVEGGFVLINELPLETYLNYVVPSEMPSGYSAEALKAQAVCARTYAYKHLQSYAYPEYEAHVDDSVIYQVYNNTGSAESTTQAVKDTAGQILTYQNQPITAYYFPPPAGIRGMRKSGGKGTGNRPLTCGGKR